MKRRLELPDAETWRRTIREKTAGAQSAMKEKIRVAIEAYLREEDAVTVGGVPTVWNETLDNHITHPGVTKAYERHAMMKEIMDSLGFDGGDSLPPHRVFRARKCVIDMWIAQGMPTTTAMDAFLTRTYDRQAKIIEDCLKPRAFGQTGRVHIRKEDIMQPLIDELCAATPPFVVQWDEKGTFFDIQ